ncbi:MAG: hypothetical protein RL196_1520 [Actinomycetota bacterium]
MVLIEPSNHSKRIVLWLTPVSDLGGVARHILDVVKCGVPGFELIVAGPPGLLAHEVSKVGGTYKALDFGPRYGFSASRRSLTKILSEYRPIIVHSHLAYADFILASTSFTSGSKFISTEHGIAAPDIYSANGARAFLVRVLHRMRSYRFVRFIAVSESTKKVMLQKWGVKTPTSVVYNGVDVPEKVARSKIPTDGSICALTLSRLSPEKQIDAVIQAFRLVVDVDPAANLLIAGEGPERAKLEELTQNLKLSDNCSFLGHVDPQAALERATLLIQVSKWENCSYSLLDARVSGVPVLATAVGGNPELVPEEYLIRNLESAELAQRILEKKESMKLPQWQSTQEMSAKIAVIYEEVLKNDS